MPMRPSPDPSLSLWNLIAVQLRKFRQHRQISGQGLAEVLDLDRSTVSRLESADIKLETKHAVVLDREWDTGRLFEVLVLFAKSGHDPEWFKTHVTMESRASVLRIWELSWMPGLFQTEAYARAMLEAAGVEDIDAHLKPRMARQKTLGRKPAPVTFVLLDQGVIEQPVGSAAIMREQLGRLVDLAQQPNVTIRIVPRQVGAHIGRDGSFKIMTVDGRDAVYIEAPGGSIREGGRLVVDASEVRWFSVSFDRIGSVALPANASLAMIREAMEAL